MNRLSIGYLAGLIVSAVLLAGCSGPRAEEGGFNSENPAAKLYAIQQAGEAKDTAAVPDLIEQLYSDDPAVRLYSIVALEKITGTRRDYSPYDPPYKRDAAVRDWSTAYESGELNLPPPPEPQQPQEPPQQ